MSYHFAQRLRSLQTTRPYIYFASDKALSRKQIPDEMVSAIGRCHDHVISIGHPIALMKLVPHFRKEDQGLTDKVVGAVTALGVADEYMIPVYGPYGVNGVISFGFPTLVKDLDREALVRLEDDSSMVHRHTVRHFGRSNQAVLLSVREKQVLRWIARGKSRTDIATILDLGVSSVDTYTRRIFAKLGVHDRVTATMKAMQDGVLDHQDYPNL